MTDYKYTQVLMWDNLGGFAKIARNQRVNVLNPASCAPSTPTVGTVAPGLTQGGVSVGWLTSGSDGHADFTSTLGTIRVVGPNGWWRDVTSPDIMTEAVGAKADAEAAAASAAASAALVGAPADSAIATAVNGPGTLTRAALNSTFAPKGATYALASANGVVGDGATDDTAALNSLLSAAASVGLGVQLAPDSIVRIATTGGLVLPSGTRLNLNGATIKAAAPSVNDRLVHIESVSNVVVFNGILDGDKANFASATEQRHNVRIVASSNVTLRDVVSKNAKGDGIYIGDDIVGLSANVTLDRVTCDNNHRQGMSVSAVDGLNAVACRFTNTSGTAPQAGVDIEPNTDTSIVRRVKMVGCVFTGNATQGLIVSTRATPSVVQDGGEYVGCSFDQNGTDGVYLNNAANTTFTGGTVKGNASRGVWFSSATAGFIENVKLLGVDIIGNGGKGLLVDQKFNRLKIASCTILNNTGIGVDVLPIAASAGFQWVANTSGNSSGVSQTHGIRTGANVAGVMILGNSYPANATATVSFAHPTRGIELDDTDVNLYRYGTDRLKTDDKFLAVAGLGVGNSAAATTPGAVVRKMQVFDETGASLGFVPIYSAIT